MRFKKTSVPSSEFIRKKLEGKKLTEGEIYSIVDDILSGKLGGAEIAYFVSGQKLAGMDDDETYYLTRAMIGDVKKISFGNKIISDKHCIGGVAGNRTTPIVVSICAALGLTIPKTSSRAITSAAGTADVIETMAKIKINAKELQRIIKKEGACLIWNSEINLAPTDDKIIRVERLLGIDIPSQLIASVLAKKISMGSKNILIDIPYGEGSKVETAKKAKELKRSLLNIARRFKLNTSVVFTDGRNPIGNGIGPVLEMIDVIRVLRNDPAAPLDLRKKALFLAAELLKLNGVSSPKRKAKKALNDGRAYAKFKGIINAQNKAKDFETRTSKLSAGKFERDIYWGPGGIIKGIDNRSLNALCRILGCPNDARAGVYLHRKKGIIRKGERVVTLYSSNSERLIAAIEYFWQKGIFKTKQLKA